MGMLGVGTVSRTSDPRQGSRAPQSVHDLQIRVKRARPTVTARPARGRDAVVRPLYIRGWPGLEGQSGAIGAEAGERKDWSLQE